MLREEVSFVKRTANTFSPPPAAQSTSRYYQSCVLIARQMDVLGTSRAYK